MATRYVLNKCESICFMDRYASIDYFAYEETESIKIDEGMVLTDKEYNRVRFLLPCRLWSPDSPAFSREHADTVQLGKKLPQYLGFRDYTDYLMYFESHSANNRVLKMSKIFLKAGGIEDLDIPNNYKASFKSIALQSQWDVVPKAMKICRFNPALKIELEKDEEEEEYLDPPQSDLYKEASAKNLFTLFPVVKDHKVVNWMKIHQQNVKNMVQTEFEEGEWFDKDNMEKYKKQMQEANRKTLMMIREL